MAPMSRFRKSKSHFLKKNFAIQIAALCGSWLIKCTPGYLCTFGLANRATQIASIHAASKHTYKLRRARCTLPQSRSHSHRYEVDDFRHPFAQPAARFFLDYLFR
jgi:hypothetical protein